MEAMAAPIRWTDVALRLALTVIVGLLIGYNRSEHGKAAGMRTTLLVCLAASVAMIQVNLLLPTSGRTSDSFIMNDLMRLPLGILTGVGFIGGGAILHRGDIIVGVTTAATLWLVTVIGLCLGGGQIALGGAATILGLLALWVLKWIESGLQRQHHAQFSIELDATGHSERDIRRRLELAALSVTGARIVLGGLGGHRKLVFEVTKMRRGSDIETPAFIGDLAVEVGVLEVHWQDRSDES
jgi:putative Mg2+ transporter-C (MgtC) family protein